MMNVSEYTHKHISFGSWNARPLPVGKNAKKTAPQRKFTPLAPLRQWLNDIKVDTPELAHRLCELIPAQCPFAKTIKIFGRTLFSIPPLCKLNPLYNELVALRFRAICYLADECGENVSDYC